MGFLAFEPPLLGLLRQDDCLSFSHNSARQRYALVTQKDRKKIERVTEMDIKKKKKKKKLLIVSFSHSVVQNSTIDIYVAVP